MKNDREGIRKRNTVLLLRQFFAASRLVEGSFSMFVCSLPLTFVP